MSMFGTRPGYSTSAEAALLTALNNLAIGGVSTAIQKTGASSFANVAIGSGGGSGTVTSIATDNTLSGGTITTTGILGINLSNANTWAAVQTFSSSSQTNILNLESTLYADQFAGSDIGAKINAAYAALGANGGVIIIPTGTYSFSTPIVFGTNGKFATLQGTGAASTILKFTPTSGNAITVNDGNPTGHLMHELTGFTLQGKSSLVAAGQTNTNTSIGIFYGGANGAVAVSTHHININGFGSNWEIGSNAYMLSFHHSSNSGGNGGQASRGSLVHIDVASNSGERNVFDTNSFTDPGNSDATNAIYITNAGTATNFFTNNSFDDVQILVGASDGQTVINNNHFENSAFSTYPQYIPVLGVSSDKSTMITFIGNQIANDGNSSGTTFQTIIKHGGQLVCIGTMINNYGGQTVTALVDHSLDNGLSSDLVGMTQIQGGGLTNIVAGSGGQAYSQANGTAFSYNVGNSYTIGLRANSNNTNEFYSGSTTTGSFDHSGNWVLGLASSTYTLTGLSSNGIVTTSGGTGALSIISTTGSGSAVLTTNPTIVKPVMNATNPTAQTYTPAGAATATLDLSLANQHDITMPAGNITIALSNDTNNQVFMVSITQDSGGSRTVAWFTTIKWTGGTTPTLTTTANKRDVFGFKRTGSGTYDGYIIGQNI